VNRRNFLKLTAAGAVSFALQACGQTIQPHYPLANRRTNLFSASRQPNQYNCAAQRQPHQRDSAPAPRGLAAIPTTSYTSDCNPITGLSVTIDIKKEIVSDIGFSFQLNACRRRARTVSAAIRF